jgi:hypothetical protein
MTMMMSVEQSVISLAGTIEGLEKILPHFSFVHHKSHMN